MFFKYLFHSLTYCVKHKLPAEHTVRPFARVIHLLVVTTIARKSPTATWEPQPAVALRVVFASAIIWQRLPSLDT